MPATPVFKTIDDVVSGFHRWEDRFRRANDRRSVFVTLYGLVSAEIRQRLSARFFTDNEWTHRYAVAFANLYRDALIAHDTGHVAEVPKAWRLCFDVAKAGTGLVLQDLFLGVNAHVNNDLPFALSGVSINPDRALRYKDHSAVNAVLASVVEPATARIAALYAPGLTALDNCAGQLDEMLSLFSLDTARESAWESAVALSNARNPWEKSLTATLISSRATVMARLLLSPSLKPPFVEVCRRVEQGPNWLMHVSEALTPVATQDTKTI